MTKSMDAEGDRGPLLLWKEKRCVIFLRFSFFCCILYVSQSPFRFPVFEHVVWGIGGPLECFSDVVNEKKILACATYTIAIPRTQQTFTFRPKNWLNSNKSGQILHLRRHFTYINFASRHLNTEKHRIRNSYDIGTPIRNLTLWLSIYCIISLLTVYGSYLCVMLS